MDGYGKVEIEMIIKEMPQRSDFYTMSYEINNDILEITINGTSEVFDFTGLPDGVIDSLEIESLSINPIIEAKKEDGILTVSMIRFYGSEEKHIYEFEEVN